MHLSHSGKSSDLFSKALFNPIVDHVRHGNYRFSVNVGFLHRLIEQPTVQIRRPSQRNTKAALHIETLQISDRAAARHAAPAPPRRPPLPLHCRRRDPLPDPSPRAAAHSPVARSRRAGPPPPRAPQSFPPGRVPAPAPLRRGRLPLRGSPRAAPPPPPGRLQARALAPPRRPPPPLRLLPAPRRRLRRGRRRPWPRAPVRRRMASRRRGRGRRCRHAPHVRGAHEEVRRRGDDEAGRARVR